ncbi:hypothetical protein Hanom_Chr09g00788891 [Helianthus anomalus]
MERSWSSRNGMEFYKIVLLFSICLFLTSCLILRQFALLTYSRTKLQILCFLATSAWFKVIPFEDNKLHDEDLNMEIACCGSLKVIFLY